MTPRTHGWAVGHVHRERGFNSLPACHRLQFKLDLLMDIASEAARLRAAAEAKPMRLPVNRKVDETHHVVTPDGLSVWYTIQVSPHRRIQEAVFERADRMPTDEECRSWLNELFEAKPTTEAPSFPGSTTRRFEVFENAS